MSAIVTKSGDVARISMTGEFDFSNQEELRLAFEQAVEAAGGRIEIDLENTTFIDSGVIRLLLMLRDLAGRNNQTMSIVNCNEHIREIFQIGGFDQIFDIR